MMLRVILIWYICVTLLHAVKSLVINIGQFAYVSHDSRHQCLFLFCCVCVFLVFFFVSCSCKAYKMKNQVVFLSNLFSSQTCAEPLVSASVRLYEIACNENNIQPYDGLTEYVEQMNPETLTFPILDEFSSDRCLYDGSGGVNFVYLDTVWLPLWSISIKYGGIVLESPGHSNDMQLL